VSPTLVVPLALLTMIEYPGLRRVDCLGPDIPWFGMQILCIIYFCSTQTMLEAQYVFGGSTVREAGGFFRAV
jgi:hypothetical protein